MAESRHDHHHSRVGADSSSHERCAAVEFPTQAVGKALRHLADSLIAIRPRLSIVPWCAA